jgi:hypothetical protein
MPSDLENAMSQIMRLNSGLAAGSKYGQYYRHSGQINLGGVLAALTVGILAGSAMGVVYSAAIIFIPIAKLHAFCCLFYGIALGAVPAVLLKKFKVRNLPISLVIVGTVTLISFYVSWVSWEEMIITEPRFPPFATLAADPRAVYEVARLINEHGAWSLGHGATIVHEPEPMKGMALLAVWVAEAAIVFGSAFGTVRTAVREQPFCEKCERWCSGPVVLRETAFTDVKELKAKLESGDFAFVAALPVGSGRQFLQFHHHWCAKCKVLNTLSVISRTAVIDRKGKVKRDVIKTVLNKLLVSGDDLLKIMPSSTDAAPPTPSAAATPAAGGGYDTILGPSPHASHCLNG